MSSKEELYKVLIESAPYGALFVVYGVCIDANTRAFNQLDCDKKQLIGTSLDEITGNESTALIDLKLQLKKALNRSEREFEWNSPGANEPTTVKLLFVNDSEKEIVVTLERAQAQADKPSSSASQPHSSQPQSSEPKSSEPQSTEFPPTKNTTPGETGQPVAEQGKPVSDYEERQKESAATDEFAEDSHNESAYSRHRDEPDFYQQANRYPENNDWHEQVEERTPRQQKPYPGEARERHTERNTERNTDQLPPRREQPREPIIVEGASPRNKSAEDNFPPSRVQSRVDYQNVKVETRRQTNNSSREYFFDKMTGLPNRQMLLKKVGEFLAENKDRDICGLLLMMDLDHFKDINNSWGHAAGDKLLKKIGRAIAGTVTGDNLLARLSGDEFVLFIPRISENIADAAWEAQAVAEKVRDIASASQILDGHEVYLTTSIGIALLTDSNLTAERALQFADTATYEAKRKGRNGIAFFDPTLTEKAHRDVDLSNRLRRALDNQEFVLFVQPQISVETGELVGGEVLLRWMSSDRVTSMPSEFIPLLERSGLIVDVGRWVIRTSCEYLRNLIDDGLWRPHMKLGVNISPRQFHDPQLLDVIEHSVQSYNVDPRYLNFEITENLVIEDVDDAIIKMQQIKELGSRFSIDDFGIGYSSMIYLKRLPLDCLKIDREFIRNIHTDSDSRGVVEAIMAVSKQYGLQVTAEGVENNESLDIVRSLGCNAYQGAHYSMPVPYARFKRMLAA